MYTYGYERISVDMGWTMLPNSKCEMKGHRETIDRWAKIGRAHV